MKHRLPASRRDGSHTTQVGLNRRMSFSRRVPPRVRAFGSIHFYDVVRLPGLVEELDASAIEAQGHQEIPVANSLDEIRVRGVGGLRTSEPEIDRAVAVGRDLVEAVDRR